MAHSILIWRLAIFLLTTISLVEAQQAAKKIFRLEFLSLNRQQIGVTIAPNLLERAQKVIR